MDIKQIKEIAKIMRENSLTALEITEGDSCLRMERKHEEMQNVQANPVDSLHVLAEKEGRCPAPLHAESINVMEVKSPMVGVFYSKPSPDAQPYVQVGSHVKKGDVLCVIEAMKLLNEITAERDGEIVGICVEDGQMVEYSQVLFQMA